MFADVIKCTSEGAKCRYVNVNLLHDRIAHLRKQCVEFSTVTNFSQGVVISFVKSY
jgi:hypothetical protein